jgi:hypothetical protein
MVPSRSLTKYTRPFHHIGVLLVPAKSEVSGTASPVPAHFHRFCAVPRW